MPYFKYDSQKSYFEPYYERFQKERYYKPISTLSPLEALDKSTLSLASIDPKLNNAIEAEIQAQSLNLINQQKLEPKIEEPIPIYEEFKIESSRAKPSEEYQPEGKDLDSEASYEAKLTPIGIIDM